MANANFLDKWRNILLICHGLFLEESKRADELLSVDLHILKEVKTRQKNITMVWINYEKVIDIIPQS